jgi:hypothetical protein
VPAMTGVKPKLTPFAVFALALVMILAAVFHIVRGEYNFVPSIWRREGSPRSSRMDSCLWGPSRERVVVRSSVASEEC